MGRNLNARILIKLLRDREHNIGAEIGVFVGDTSRRLLKWLPDLKMLICVDPWELNKVFVNAMPRKYGRIVNANWEEVKEEFRACVLAPYAGRVWAIKNTSLRAARMVENSILDFVFIDANHSYEYVRKDIYAWWPKIRIGGIMCGDDYKNKPGYGVIQATQEIFGNRIKLVKHIWYVERTKGELK